MQKEEKKLVLLLKVISNKFPFNEKNPIILSRNLYYNKKDKNNLNKKISRENSENNKNLNEEKIIKKP